MKKKLLIILMSVVMCFSALCFSACSDGDELRHVKKIEATCEKEGRDEYWTDGKKYYSDSDGKHKVEYESLIISKKPHTPSSKYSSNKDGHYHACTVCGNAADEVVEHTLVKVVDQKPTATAAGQSHKECEICNYKTEFAVIPPTSEGETVLLSVPAREATCLQAGNIAYWTDGTKFYGDAEGKNEIERADVIIAKKQHTKSGDWGYDDTRHWHLCTVVGGNQSRHSFGDEDEHEFVLKPADPSGVVYEECECGKKRAAQDVGEATEIPYSDSTCAIAGTQACWLKNGVYYRDQACTTVMTDEERIIPVKPHTPEDAWTVADGGHYHRCSVCGGEADSVVPHEYSDSVVEPTCTIGGYTDHECVCGHSYRDGETNALGHDEKASAFVVNSENANGGRFYYACSRCGLVSEKLCNGDWPDAAWADRKIIVNEVTYGSYSLYVDENLKDKGVSFDPLLNNGTFVIDASKFPDGLAIREGNGSGASEQMIVVKGDVTIASLSFGDGYKPSYIRGDGKLTVTGDVSSISSVTNIEADVTVNGNFAASNCLLSGKLTVNGNYNNFNNNGTLRIAGGALEVVGTTMLTNMTVSDGGADLHGTLSVINLTVGDAENAKSPTVNIKVNGASGLTNNVAFNGTKATFDILSGTVTLQQGGSGRTGIDLTNVAGSVVTVGEHATVNIKNFTNGVYSGAGDAVLDIRGTVNMIVGESGAYKAAVKVNGGALNILTNKYAVREGSVELTSGSAALIRNMFGDAALQDVSTITVSDGFSLGVKNFGGIVAGSTTEDGITLETTITVENINGGNIEAELAKVKEKCVEGTITPDTVVIDDLFVEPAA